MAIVLSTDADFKEHLANNKSVIVKYYADWCGSCRLFAPKYKRVSNEDEMADVTFLEVDAENNPEARKMAGVDNLPFLAAFKNGELVEGSAGSKEEYLRSLIEKSKN
tara:strand:- start:273 stop:593 length:321 start_codon:yes stop_codon:yes gene_type:complete